MIVIYGSRMYGKIDRCGRTFIATLFAHIYWLPLFPLGSKLVLEENGDGTYRFIAAGLNWRSVLAAYLRTWGVLGAIAAVFTTVPLAMSQFDSNGEVLEMLATVFSVLVCVAAVVGAWAWLGRLSADERAQRIAYQDFAGHPIDVAMMREARYPLRDRLYGHVVERARGMISGGYRTTVEPTTHWGAIALDPTVSDVPFLRAALTLSRLEWSFAQGPARAQLASAHGMLWQKLRAADPTLLADAKAVATF